MHWNLIFSILGLCLFSYGDISKWPVRPYKNCIGQIWYVHWFQWWKASFGRNSIAVQSWEVCVLKIGFFQWRSCDSYREFFKVPCAAVHEPYRSNLVCTLIPILKGVFWSKQHSCTVLGSMCTGIWFFRLWVFIYLAMEIFQTDLCGPTRTVQVKSGMYIDSYPERCVLVQTA